VTRLVRRHKQTKGDGAPQASEATQSVTEGVSDMAGLGTSLHRLQVCSLGTGGDALTEFEAVGAP
jgi:hypothetical protein